MPSVTKRRGTRAPLPWVFWCTGPTSNCSSRKFAVSALRDSPIHGKVHLTKKQMHLRKHEIHGFTSQKDLHSNVKVKVQDFASEPILLGCCFRSRSSRFRLSTSIFSSIFCKAHRH